MTASIVNDQVEVGGRRVAFARAGAGEPLVLIHGAWSDSRTWRHQLEGLSDQFAVIAWDAPGFGRSADPPDSFRMPDYADVLAGFIAALGLDHPHVLGLSFGGALALELYRRHPTIPRSLILASAYAGWAGSLPPDVVRQRVERWVRESDDLAAHARDYVPEFFTGSADPADIAEVVAIMGDARASGMLAATRSMAEADLRDVLPRISVPVLLLYGDADRRSPIDIANDLHRSIPTSTLVVLEGIGHLANVDAPDRFDAEVRRFLTATTT
jgi:pimeloyl-ACP methyl ester carboxylesterase